MNDKDYELEEVCMWLKTWSDVSDGKTRKGRARWGGVEIGWVPKEQ